MRRPPTPPLLTRSLLTRSPPDLRQALFCVAVSFCYSTGLIGPTPALGFCGLCIALLPLSLLPRDDEVAASALSEPMLAAEEASAAKEEAVPAATSAAQVQPSKPALPARRSSLSKFKAAAHAVIAAGPTGVPATVALAGLDFWLLFFMQLAVFGGGVAANQNLALIFESARSPASSGLGVALFALASTVSRVSVGVLSDKYSEQVSRFGWLIAVSATATAGQLLLSPMVAGFILTGTFCLGLSFGSFFTLVVPVVNEMCARAAEPRAVLRAASLPTHSRSPAHRYGRRHFGVIMGASLGSQAVASFAISVELLPFVYRMAAHGLGVCYGPDCFLDSFLALATLNALGLGAAIWLSRRNKDSLPVDRYYARDS